MSANYLNKAVHKVAAWKWIHSRFVYMLVWPAWLVVSLGLAMAVVWTLLYLLTVMHVSFVGINTTILQSAIAAAIYLAAILIAVGLPWWLKHETTLQDIGLSRWPSWGDIGLAPVGFIIYFIASGLLVYLASQIIGFDMSQVQETGFTRLSHVYEYALAFITLIVVAPLAEEILFRGFLYGRLRRRLPVWVSIIVTSLLFGAVHGQWNVGIDVFALSIVLCGLRETTGSIWAGILLHMLKNSVAFFIVFITPML